MTARIGIFTKKGLNPFLFIIDRIQNCVNAVKRFLEPKFSNLNVKGS